MGAVAFALFSAQPASALRIMTYNILNYSSGRDAQFRLVIEESAPDVVVAQEVINTQAAVDSYLNSVLNFVNPGEWSAATFTNGNDTDNALFYKTALVQEVSHFDIQPVLRQIDEWKIRPIGYDAESATIRVYSVHLKASQGSAEEQQRLDEVTTMRARMETFPAGQNYIVVGDTNIYTHTEAAYQYMLSPSHGLAGVLVDPLNMPGNWHINASFAAIHTQSPRTASFGGGATGGMDDRFDFILRSPSLGDDEGLDLLEQTYKAFGQDGLHFDVALIDPPLNAVVPQVVAQALHDASDHLPVLADFQLPAILLATASLDFNMCYVGTARAETLHVTNVAALPADELSYSMVAPSGFTAPAGSFAANAGAGPNAHLVTLDTATSGIKSGDLALSSDDVDSPTTNVALTGVVLDHAAPSVDAGNVVVSEAIDFGTHAVGAFTDAAAEVFNVGFGPNQGEVEVYAAALTGDARFSIVGGFTPSLVGGTPASYAVHFDDTAAADGAYTGVLTLQTRDPQSIPGALLLSDLVYNLAATVSSGAVDVALGDAGAIHAGFASLSPNPTLGSVSIRFGVTRDLAVDLRVYDVGGRLVRNLLQKGLGRGEHTLVWDGRDDSGRDVAGGIYFVRLVSEESVETRKIVRVE